jgi:hypothetical protein
LHAVYIQKYDIVDAGLFGEGAGWTGRTDSAATDEIRAAFPSDRRTTNPSERGPRDHQTIGELKIDIPKAGSVKLSPDP